MGTIKVCPLCNGTGLKISDKEFFMEECECTQIKRIQDHVKELEGDKFLTSTKLLPHLNENRSLVIETDSIKTARCHIKTALVYNGKFKTFKILNPSGLVDLAVTNQTVLEKVDLLVIEAPVFLHYEKASQWHEFIMATRDALGKPTWFVIRGTLQNFKESKNVIFTSGFLKLLSSYKTERVTEKETNPLIKSPTVTTTVQVNRGFGVIGVNPKLLNFHSEMDKRLHDVKE